MCNVARIDAFLARWPNAEFGPAHIVLGDANIEDHNLQYCAALCRQWLGVEPKEDVGLWSAVDGWADHKREEIEATLRFLEDFLLIPHDQRVEPGDVLCKGWPEDE